MKLLALYLSAIVMVCWSDLVFDVRFLPNPYFVESLKSFDGHHNAVRDYVLKNKESEQFLQKVLGLLELLSLFMIKEGRLNIALGCGGKRRSVVMANESVCALV